MLAITNSIALQGLDGYLVSIQVDISNGLPQFEIVGLPDASVKEAKERVKAAIKNSNMEIPSRRILINLAPANTKKEGSKFDLPIAIGILIAVQNMQDTAIKEFLRTTVFVGELALNGNVEKVSGVLPMCIEAKKLGIKRIILPKENAKEAAIIDGIDIMPVTNIIQIMEYLNGEGYIEKEQVRKIKIQIKANYSLDFADVKGQENAKRALEIAAAGGHNCLLIGTPGAGKTMLAKSFPSILPDMTYEEMLEVTKIYSIEGLTSDDVPIISTRPFRSPHHNVTATALIGGGRTPRPGEISLAHHGVLFLDELNEFSQNTLECLREPLEDRQVTISRVNASITYPCNFIFIASMNPCPCGYYGAEEKECCCTPEQIKRYQNKISGPLLDRIDMYVDVSGVKFEKLENEQKGENSEQIRERINNARKVQTQRYQNNNIFTNSQLTRNLIEQFCKLNLNSKKVLELAFQKLGLSARAYEKILKVARTIADLEGTENIKEKHIAEAIQYRSLDRRFLKK